MARKQWYFAYGSNLDLQRYESRIGRLAANGYDPDEVLDGEYPDTCPICKNDECVFHDRDWYISKKNYEIFKKIYDVKQVKLKGFKFEFNKDGGVGIILNNYMSPKKPEAITYSNIMPRKNGVVFGVIYSCTEEEFEILDGYEGTQSGHYKRFPVNVVDVQTGKTYKATTYVACEDKIVKPPPYLRPTNEYLEFILQGGRWHKLPKKYLDKIADLTAVGVKNILYSARQTKDSMYD